MSQHPYDEHVRPAPGGQPGGLQGAPGHPGMPPRGAAPQQSGSQGPLPQGMPPQGMPPHGGPGPQQPGPHRPGPHRPGPYQPGPHRPGPQQSAAPHLPAPQHGLQQPAQRVYAQPRFSPTVTQEMRIRHQVQQHSGAPVDAPWAAQAARRLPREDPTAGANIARIIVASIVGAILLLGMLAILIFGALSFDGAGPLVIGLSAIPLVLIILMVLWFDRWKPQPKLLLLVCLLWGAVASVIMTLIASWFGIAALAFVGLDASGDVFGAVVMAPVIEEITKGILLVVIVLAARKHFEGPLDGWVYGSLIGAGFAFTENILYLGGAYVENADAGLWQTFVMRCLMSPLLHSAFVACAGVSIGFAARRGAWWLTAIMWLPGLLAGMVLHAVWNGAATVNSVLVANGVMPVLVSLGITLLLSALIAISWFVLGLVFRHNEAAHTRQSLGDYANVGWLTHSEVDMLGTWKGRRAGKRWARQYPNARDHMRTMIRLAANLAATRTRVLAGVGGETERKVELYLLERFTMERGALMGAVNHRSHRSGRA